MARHQPAKTGTGEPLPEKVKMRLDAKGRFVPVLPEQETTETTEAAERPATPDDPRASSFQNIPPYAAGI